MGFVALGFYSSGLQTLREIPIFPLDPSRNPWGVQQRLHNWVAAQELKVSFCNKETLLLLCTHIRLTSFKFLDSNPVYGALG